MKFLGSSLEVPRKTHRSSSKNRPVFQGTSVGFSTRAQQTWEELIRKGVVVNADAKENLAEVTRLKVRHLYVFDKHAFDKLLLVIQEVLLLPLAASVKW